MNIYAGLSRAPSVDEVGIDLVRLKLFGRWYAEGSPSARQRMLHEHLNRLRDDHGFERPGQAGSRIFCSLRSSAPLTLRSVSLTFSGDQAAQHNLFIKATLNPTRTLNRLLGMYVPGRDWRNRIGFLDWAAEMTSDEFFIDPDPAGPAEWDNFVSRPVVAQLELGRDPFAAFLPIYCAKFQDWIADLFPDVNADTAAASRHAGPHATTAAAPLTMVINPSETRLADCEAYFERQVASAHVVVQHLARAALASINNVRAQLYENVEASTGDDGVPVRPVSFNEVERKGAGIGVTAPLTQDRSLLIYAKRRDRIRFEIKYSRFTGRGDDEIDGVPDGSLAGDLLRRLESARRSLPTHANWPDVLALACQPERSDATAFIHLIAAVRAASLICSETTFQRALHDLIVTGGISVVPEEPELCAMAVTLTRRGILVQRRVCVRDRSGIGKRYALAEPYLATRELIADAFDRGAGL